MSIYLFITENAPNYLRYFYPRLLLAWKNVNTVALANNFVYVLS